jgi:hypothetical protein
MGTDNFLLSLQIVQDLFFNFQTLSRAEKINLINEMKNNLLIKLEDFFTFSMVDTLGDLLTFRIRVNLS